MDAYAPEIKRKMKRLFDSLSEDDRRHYAAVQRPPSWGMVGSSTFAETAAVRPKTIRRGLAELDEAADLDTSRVRKKGGGRKKLIEVSAALENFLKVLEDHAAGDPMRAGCEMDETYREEDPSRVTELKDSVSRHIVSRVLANTSTANEKTLKKKTMGPAIRTAMPEFENIAPFEEGVFEGRPARS